MRRWLKNPELTKKVIYQDQFIMSNIMKMYNAHHAAEMNAPIGTAVAPELFEAVGLLRCMQLVVCPNSTEHHDESLISDFFDILKRLSERFCSTGISFLN